jgi:hypothetical protein
MVSMATRIAVSGPSSRKKLADRQMAGQVPLAILDPGCGPATWLRRVITHAHWLGFSQITARGFDIALAQTQVA